jgi:hypothetical protein
VVQAIRWRLPWWAGVAVCAAAGAAAADPIVDREYAIDFYEGVAIGDTAQVGMGGAGAARVTGSAGALLNPSAPAVRQTTDTDAWSWDYHLDALTGRYSSDYDNNGVAADQASGASLLTGGLALRFGDWSGAVTVTGQRAPLGESSLDAEAARSKLVIARWLPRLDLAIGAGVQTVAFRLSAGGRVLFDVTGGGLVAGATYVPRMERFRAGIAVETAIIGILPQQKLRRHRWENVAAVFTLITPTGGRTLAPMCPQHARSILPSKPKAKQDTSLIAHSLFRLRLHYLATWEI